MLTECWNYGTNSSYASQHYVYIKLILAKSIAKTLLMYVYVYKTYINFLMLQYNLTV